MKSVLQDWVNELSLRKQGVLVLALRGPDGVAKEDNAKPMVRTLRALVMNSGRLGVPMEHGQSFDGDRFMTMARIETEHSWLAAVTGFLDDWDKYNVHFLQHLAHAFAIAGMHYPVQFEANQAWWFYVSCCHKMHMHCETKSQIDFRLRDGIRPEADE